jgi:cell division protein ZapA (FtsZ GTPase activity inhibitor)
MNSVKVDLLGISFSIETDKEPAQFSQLLEYVKRNVSAVEAQTGVHDPLKLAVLSSLLISDDYLAFKSQMGELEKKAATSRFTRPDEEHAAALEEAERITLRLISSLDERLG